MPRNNGTAIQPREPLVLQSSRLMQYSTWLDSNRGYHTDTPDPQQFANTIKSADDGEIGDLLKLNEEMEAKDAHLQSVAATRRRALTALEWKIVPLEWQKDQALADDVASYCEEELRAVPTLDATLEHLATAIGPGLAVSELIWEKMRLVETVDVPGHRLLSDPYESQQILIETEDDFMGIPTPAGKFIVYAPNARAGYPLAVTMTRAAAWLFIVKHYARADWAARSEKFGMPIMVVQLAETVPDNVKSEAVKFARDVSADGWTVTGVPTDESSFSLLEPSSGAGPYQDLIEWAERKQSILYLGQHGTTEIGDRGSFAAIKVHDNVRADLLLSDMQNEARCLRQSLLRPLARAKWPKKKELPVPHWERVLLERADTDEARLNLDRLRLANEMGMLLDEDTRYEWLGAPKPRPIRTPDDQERPNEEIVTDATSSD